MEESANFSAERMAGPVRLWQFGSQDRASHRSPPRYANMRRITLLSAVAFSALLLLACPARWQVVFINGADQPLAVTVSGSVDGAQHSFRLESGNSRSELEQHVQRLEVFGSSGELLSERDDFGSKDLAPPVQGKYPHIYVLLTTTNAYLVPPDYVKTWRQHIDEITKTRA